MAKIDALCRKASVTIIPTKQRRRGRQTQARRTLTKLAQEMGEGHVLFVLRAIVESEGNSGELWSETIAAVSDVVRLHPHLADRGLAFIEAMDAIPLGALRLQAQATRIGTTREALAVLLILRLEQQLGFPKLPEAA